MNFKVGKKIIELRSDFSPRYNLLYVDLETQLYNISINVKNRPIKHLNVDLIKIN
jgi:hypothetical protein